MPPKDPATLTARQRMGVGNASLISIPSCYAGANLPAMNHLLCCSFLALFAALSSAPAADNMKAFPPAGEGMTRHVIHLPQQADEAAFKVELIIGKTVNTDAVNRYFFAGNLETETIVGWGFDRYILRKIGPMAGTLIGVDPNAPKVDRFVTIGGEPHLIRYNSRLPMVIYVPTGVEVRYRLWRADPKSTAADKG